MDVIEDMFRNYIKKYEKIMLRDEEYARARNQIDQYYKVLNSKLEETELEKLNKLVSCYDTTAEKTNSYCFKEGFKTGLAVAAESLK